jgi:hypothetical protein
MRLMWDAAKWVLPVSLLIAAILIFFDVAGVHGIAPYNPKPIEQVYWRFPIYVAVVFLVLMFVALRKPSN